ncbi:hypothetical protein ASG48_15520 [Aurantimonas sp. Leaf443]|nr:hypothetical protein ASG48_15520 [Aurantimonas sp. Leaf443]
MVTQRVDEAARALARRLLRAARTAALGCLRPQDGFPAVSRTLLATDFRGRPLVLVSGLSLHSRALAADPRCSILVGEDGRGDPLAHPRMTVFARAERIGAGTAVHADLRARFLSRHPKASLYIDFPDFSILRLEPLGASLNGGFARAYELDADDLLDPAGDGLENAARRAVAHMNEDHGDAVDAIAADGTGWRIATADRRGFELAKGDLLRRIEFADDVVALGGYRNAFVGLVGDGN